MEPTSLTMVIVQGFSKGPLPQSCWNPRQVLQKGMKVTGDHVTHHALFMWEVEGSSPSGQNQIEMGRSWADSSNCGGLCEVCVCGVFVVGLPGFCHLTHVCRIHPRDCCVVNMKCPSKEV